MTLTHLPEVLLMTFIRQIAVLLLPGADGDLDAALDAAQIVLASHAPQNEAELRLAARIITFSLQAGEALAQAADPAMPLNRVLRLRTGAVSLSRESEKAERRLEKLRDARLKGLEPEPQPLPATESPRIEKTTALVADNRKIAAYAQEHGLTWSQAFKQRNREKRTLDRQRKDAMRQSASIPTPVFA